MGAIPECFRKQRGSLRSNHPLTSWAARGTNAPFITSEHELAMAQGEGSPLARLYELDAHVLLLGVSYGNNTAFHLAEYRCQHAPRHATRARVACSVEGRSTWVSYDDVGWDAGDFMTIGLDFEQHGLVCNGAIAQAPAKLFPLRAAVDYAVEWMNRNRD